APHPAHALPARCPSRRPAPDGRPQAASSPVLPRAAAGTMSGPKVFLDYDQGGLHPPYAQPSWAPNMQEVLARRGAAADAVRARLGEPQRFSYGDTPVEPLDVFAASRANAPVMVFLHGGAWRGGDARSQAFAAEIFVKAGAHLVLPDFAVVMDVGLEGMVAQVRRAVAWVAANAARFGGDPA